MRELITKVAKADIPGALFKGLLRELKLAVSAIKKKETEIVRTAVGQRVRHAHDP